MAARLAKGMDVLAVRELGHLARAWDGLVDRMPLPSPFLRSWWLDGTAVHATRYLLVLAGDDLIGGFPIEVRRRRGVERVTVAGEALAPDHLDLLTQPECEAPVREAMRTWFGRPGARVVDLAGVAPGGGIGHAVPGLVWEDALAIAPFTPLPSSFEEYLHGHRGARTSVRDSARRLRRDGDVVHRTVAPSDIERGLEELRRLHAATWQGGSGFLPNFDRFARAARVGVGEGELVLHELVIADQVVASQVVFDLAGRVSHYQGGRSPDRRWRGAGSVLMAAVIEDACSSGRAEFDCLRGDSAYKRVWASEQRPLLRLRAGHGVSGWTLAGVGVAMERSRRRLGRLRRRAQGWVGWR